MSRSRRARLAGHGARMLAVIGLPAVAGCYSFSGGGGLPGHVETAYVEPALNQTTRFGLSEQLTQQLTDAARERLGLQLAGEGIADAVIRATIQRYSDDAISFDALEGEGADVFQRRVTISVRVEIYDVQRDEVIWSNPSVQGVGEYEPGPESEDDATAVALENLVQQIVDGAQSQW